MQCCRELSQHSFNVASETPGKYHSPSQSGREQTMWRLIRIAYSVDVLGNLLVLGLNSEDLCGCMNNRLKFRPWDYRGPTQRFETVAQLCKQSRW
jgi:hypothetical protein